MDQDVLKIQPATLEELQKLGAGGSLYAILDACDAPSVPGKVRELGEDRAMSLYQGTAAEEQWAIAPYLARVDADLLAWIKARLWPEPWGIFAVSRYDLAALSRHFRRFLLVQAPNGEPWYFRYYDPRVLATFLPVCSAAEIRFLFGPVFAYGVHRPEEENVILMRERDRPAETAEVGWPVVRTPLFPLREPHLPPLQGLTESVFEHKLAAHLRKNNPEPVEGLPDEVLLKRIRAGIARARAWGFTYESTIAGFVALMFDFGPGFDTQARIREALLDRAIPPESRLDHLDERTSEDDWREAAAIGASHAWPDA
ncbi:MAG: DUF4123 domain-containing protein [Acidobacteria bacterium]|nr:DUF4123 domain-containing protein [Acidobacteriota bacterium]